MVLIHTCTYINGCKVRSNYYISERQECIGWYLIHACTIVSKFANMPFPLYSGFHSNNANSNTYDVKGDCIARGFFIQVVRAYWKQKWFNRQSNSSGASNNTESLNIKKYPYFLTILSCQTDVIYMTLYILAQCQHNVNNLFTFIHNRQVCAVTWLYLIYEEWSKLI